MGTLTDEDVGEERDADADGKELFESVRKAAGVRSGTF